MSVLIKNTNIVKDSTVQQLHTDLQSIITVLSNPYNVDASSNELLYTVNGTNITGNTNLQFNQSTNTLTTQNISTNAITVNNVPYQNMTVSINYTCITSMPNDSSTASYVFVNNTINNFIPNKEAIIDFNYTFVTTNVSVFTVVLYIDSVQAQSFNMAVNNTSAHNERNVLFKFTPTNTSHNIQIKMNVGEYPTTILTDSFDFLVYRITQTI